MQHFAANHFAAWHFASAQLAGGEQAAPTVETAPYYAGGGRFTNSYWDDLLEDLAKVRKAVRKKEPTVAQSAKALASAIEAEQLPVDLELQELRNATERLRQLVSAMSGELVAAEQRRRIEAARKAVIAEAMRLAKIAAERKRQEEDDEAIEILLLAA